MASADTGIALMSTGPAAVAALSRHPPRSSRSVQSSQPLTSNQRLQTMTTISDLTSRHLGQASSDRSSCNAIPAHPNQWSANVATKPKTENLVQIFGHDEEDEEFE